VLRSLVARLPAQILDALALRLVHLCRWESFVSDAWAGVYPELRSMDAILVLLERRQLLGEAAQRLAVRAECHPQRPPEPYKLAAALSAASLLCEPPE
jgi:hypothetical protein